MLDPPAPIVPSPTNPTPSDSGMYPDMEWTSTYLGSPSCFGWGFPAGAEVIADEGGETEMVEDELTVFIAGLANFAGE